MRSQTMSASPLRSPTPPPDELRALVVPCVDLTPRAPWRWLSKGWADWRRAPGLSLLFGVVIALVSVGVSALAWWLGRFALLATLLSGFVFIAPLLAVGLYCVSRQLEAGKTPRLHDSFDLARRIVGQAGVFAIAQFVILLLWSRAGMVVSALVPLRPGDIEALLEFLAIGSAIGSVFASFTFAVSVVSLPLIADREVDMITACLSSIHAVMRNKWTMLVWATVIVALTLVGFATAFLGLIIVMPWLAYASWHAYRETLIVDGLPRLN